MTNASAALTVSPEQVRWFRLRRSGLITPFVSPEAAANTLFGVQAQILPAAALALWNRTAGLTYQRFDELLFTQRTLVKLWGQRGTLHLYASSDWPLLHGARTVNRTWWERRLDEAGSAKHAALVEAIAAQLRQHETLGRSDLRGMGLELQEEHFSAWGGIFADLVRHGHACHADRDGGEGRFAHRERWLPSLTWDPPAAEMANREILRRYFAAYGPSTLADFAYWRGVSATQARPWYNQLAAELVDVEVDGQPMAALQVDIPTLTETPPPPDAWPVRLLYRFEPLLLGHKDKTWIADAVHYKQIWRPAGHIEGILLNHGRAAGVWRYERKGGAIAFTVLPFRKLTRPTQQTVKRLTAQIAHFFDLTNAGVVFEKG